MADQNVWFFPMGVREALEQFFAVHPEGVVRCWYCETELGCVLGYPHPGGIYVDDLEGFYWQYSPCPGCGYEWSLRKLARRVTDGSMGADDDLA